MKIALSIAGSDSGGGAGIQADLKTFHQFGVFGTTVITAVTAQNTRGVRAWQAMPAGLVEAQLAAVIEDLPPQATKTGMLGSSENVDLLAGALVKRRVPNYVLDPVMVATSGDRLLEREAERLVARRLVPSATLVTPNLAEAAVLVEDLVDTPDQMERAARALVKMGAEAALVTGGHLHADDLIDVLAIGDSVQRFTHQKIETRSTHGTGCTLSAAIVAGLALNRPLDQAVAQAIDFVQRAIAAAPELGAGHGPLNHFVPAPQKPPVEGL